MDTLPPSPAAQHSPEPVPFWLWLAQRYVEVSLALVLLRLFLAVCELGLVLWDWLAS